MEPSTHDFEVQQPTDGADEAERQTLSIKVVDFLSDNEKEDVKAQDDRPKRHQQGRQQLQTADLGWRESECSSDVFTQENNEAQPSNFIKKLQAAQTVPPTAQQGLRVVTSSNHEQSDGLSLNLSAQRQASKSERRDGTKPALNPAQTHRSIRCGDLTLSKAMDPVNDADYAMLLDNSHSSEFHSHNQNSESRKEFNEHNDLGTRDLRKSAHASPDPFPPQQTRTTGASKRQFEMVHDKVG